MNATTAITATRTEEVLPQFSIETISPGQAKEWLLQNVNNRKMKPDAIKALVRDMRAGRWMMNGEPIRFATNGRLLDGQHRLTAVIESGVTIQSLVVRGLSSETQITMDVGVTRKLSDFLQMRNEPNAAALASIINLYWRYERGQVLQFAVRPTIEEGLTMLEDCPGLRHSTRVAMRIKDIIRASVAGTAHYVFSTLEPEDGDLEHRDADVDDFFQRLNSGADLAPKSGLLVLRQKLLKYQDDNGQAANNAEVLAWFIKAWNAYRKGVPISLIRYVAGGANAEAFPVPV